MRIIGVTGSMASGKTHFSSILSRLFRCRVFDADKIVHSLYEHDITVIRDINELFQYRATQQSINRKQLLSRIIEQPHLLKKIEQIVHPKVQKEMISFVKLCRRSNMHTIILDIPLLFEIRADELCERIFFLKSNETTKFHRLRQRHEHAASLDALGKVRFFSKGKYIDRITFVSSGLAKHELYRYAYSAGIIDHKKMQSENISSCL